MKLQSSSPQIAFCGNFGSEVDTSKSNRKNLEFEFSDKVQKTGNCHQLQPENST